jgi:hypothetical protein
MLHIQLDMPPGAPDDVMHPLRTLWLGLMMWHEMMMYTSLER